MNRELGADEGGSHLKRFQVAHVVDQDIGVHRSQPQRMSVVPLGEVVSRKSLLAGGHANWSNVCFSSAYFRKQAGRQTNTHICPHGRLSCVFVSHYFGTRMKSKYGNGKEFMAFNSGSQRAEIRQEYGNVLVLYMGLGIDYKELLVMGHRRLCFIPAG